MPYLLVHLRIPAPRAGISVMVLPPSTGDTLHEKLICKRAKISDRFNWRKTITLFTARIPIRDVTRYQRSPPIVNLQKR